MRLDDEFSGDAADELQVCPMPASALARADADEQAHCGFRPLAESVLGPRFEGRPRRLILSSEVHHESVSLLKQLRSRIGDALTSPAELAEFAEDRRLARLPSTSRTNPIVFVGPRGGVGKTTVARSVVACSALRAAARC